MKLLYAYDIVLDRLPGSLHFAHESYHYDFWKRRYLPVFPEIIFCARVKEAGPEQVVTATVRGPGVDVRPLEMLNRPLHYFTRRRQAERSLRQTIRDADAVIARFPSEIGTLAVKAALAMDKPFLIEMVGHPFHSMWHNGSRIGKAYAPWSGLRTRLIMKKAPYAIYVTQKYLQRAYPCGGRTLSCSDVEIEPADETAVTARVGWRPVNGHVFRIGMIGTLATRYKGLETAFQALARVGTGIPWELQVLGEGSEEPWRSLARSYGIVDRIRFLGVLPSGAPVRSWLDTLNLYIQPSLTEGLPRSIIEAMSRGIPCIASSAGGIPELLPPDLMFPPRDCERMAEMIMDMALNPEKADGIARDNLLSANDYRSEMLIEKRLKFLAEFREFAENRLVTV